MRRLTGQEDSVLDTAEEADLCYSCEYYIKCSLYLQTQNLVDPSLASQSFKFDLRNPDPDFRSSFLL